MQKRCIFGFFILIAGILTALFFNKDGRERLFQLDMAIQSAELEEEKSITDNIKQLTEQAQPGMEESSRAKALEEAYQNILEFCTKEFIGYHLIDDAFLTWLCTQYGEECILEIEKEVKNGCKNTQIWHELTGNTIHVLWLLYCKQTGFQEYQLDRVVWKNCASQNETVLAFTGDINFSEEYPTTEYLDQRENGIFDCFSKDLLDLMKSMDVMVVNNEFAYSRRGKPLPGKAYTFRADPSRVDLLDAFGTDIAGLANNHVYDYGSDALLDTIAVLDEKGIPHVGAGANLEEAKKAWYFVCNGRKIAITAATQIERSTNYTKEAGENSPGVLKTLKPDIFTEVIRKEAKNSDYVIVFVHWGTEWDSSYGKDQKKLAEAFAEAGADAIIGGHTHCLQGFDMIDGVPVIYSLGNFWFSRKTQDTGLAKITIDGNGELTLSFLPCIQKDFVTSLVTGEEEKQRILGWMQKYSAPGIVITEDGTMLSTR